MRPHTTSVVRTLRMHHLRLRLYVTRTFVLLSLFLFFFFIVVPGLFSKALIRFSHSRLGLRAASIYFLQPPLPPSPLPALTLLPLRIHFLPIDNFLSCLLFFLLLYFSFFICTYISLRDHPLCFLFSFPSCGCWSASATGFVTVIVTIIITTLPIHLSHPPL